MSRSLIVLPAILVLGLTAIAPNAAAAYYSSDRTLRGTLSELGTVERMDLGYESFELVTDTGAYYAVFADRAVVQLHGGRRGDLGDVSEGALVRVYGERLSSRTIRADEIVVLDASGRFGRYRDYRPYERVEIRGYVTRVFARSGEINMRALSENYVVVVQPGTVIRRYIYVTDIHDISEGDEIRVYGTLTTRTTIKADRIHITSSDRDRRYRDRPRSYRPSASYGIREDVLEGTLVTSLDSTWTVVLRTEFGERTVEVPRTAQITRDRQTASAGNIRKGERVRVRGRWEGDILVAERLEVGIGVEPGRVEQEPAASTPTAPEPPKPREADGPRSGRIISIDYEKLEMTIDSEMTNIKVAASGAEVTRKGSTRRFSDLKKGDRVTVNGEVKDGVLTATAIELTD